MNRCLDIPVLYGLKVLFTQSILSHRPALRCAVSNGTNDKEVVPHKRGSIKFPSLSAVHLQSDERWVKDNAAQSNGLRRENESHSFSHRLEYALWALAMSKLPSPMHSLCRLPLEQ